MAQATDPQMQRFADERQRPRAEQLVRVLNAMKDDRSALSDEYDRAANGAAWAYARTDGPPTLLDQTHLLSYNTFAADVIAYIENHSEWGKVKAMAVNGLQV